LAQKNKKYESKTISTEMSGVEKDPFDRSQRFTREDHHSTQVKKGCPGCFKEREIESE
jgi:hypothetical protein